ncbi:protein SPMIP2 isoform 2-T2 [Rhinophrynus dorsalis]
MLYTGPDYVRDYRTKLPDFTGYIGEVLPSAEQTSEVKYLCRAAPGTPPPIPKDLYVRGIGWGVSAFSYLNRRQLLSNYQIKRGDFRQASEEKVTHRYQNPWTPLPHILDKQGFGARATLAWNCGIYDDPAYSKGFWTLEHHGRPTSKQSKQKIGSELSSLVFSKFEEE